MTKSSKKSECVQLGSMIFNRLLDLRDELKKDLSALLLACGVEEIEDIKDLTLYNIASDLDYNIRTMTRRAEDLNNILEDLTKLDL